MRRTLLAPERQGSKLLTDQVIRETAVGEGDRHPRRRSVVVGVDGSPASTAALSWAASEAQRTGDQVRVIHIREQPAVRFTIANRRYVGISDEAVEAKLRRDVASLRNQLGSAVDAIDVSVDAVDGDPKQVLVDLSHRVDLLILGAEGRGRRRGLLLGDVVSHCLRHAACPVVVTPPPQRLTSDYSQSEQ